MLGTITSFNKLTYTAGIWKSWVSLRGNLALSLNFAPLPTRWIVADLIPFLHPFFACIDIQVDRLLNTLGRSSILTMENMWSNEGDSSRVLEAIFVRIRGMHPWILQLTINFVDTIALWSGINHDYLFFALDWRWLDSNKIMVSSFSISNHQAYSMILTNTNNFDHSNCLWNRSDPP